MRYPREWSSYFNTLSMVNNQLHWCLVNYKFTRQKSLQTLPGKVNLLFRFSRILDLYAGGRSLFITSKGYKHSAVLWRYGHKSGRVTAWKANDS